MLPGYIQIWHFYRTLSRGLLFPGHSVFDARKLKHFDDLFDYIDAVGLREYDGRMDGETERIAVRFDFVPTSNDS